MIPTRKWKRFCVRSSSRAEAASRMEEYLRDVIRPLLAENADLLGEKQELSV